jgi:hypothetical protein
MWKESHLLRKYKIDFKDYEDLFDFQGGLCPICGHILSFEEKGLESPCLDHDHLTGEVRGIIHSRCNLALGFLKDDVEALKRAIFYLEQPIARDFFSKDLIDLDIDYNTD